MFEKSCTISNVSNYDCDYWIGTLKHVTTYQLVQEYQVINEDINPTIWFPFPMSLDLFFACIEKVAVRDPLYKKTESFLVG